MPINGDFIGDDYIGGYQWLLMAILLVIFIFVVINGNSFGDYYIGDY